MKKLLLLLLLLCGAASAQTILTGTTRWIVSYGPFAPDPNTCLSEVQVGNIYIRSQDLSNGPVNVSRCTQLTTGLYGWQPIGHLNVTTLPAHCSVGDIAFKTNAAAGSNLYGCTATDVWTAEAGGGGGSPGFTNITSGVNTQATMVVDTGASLLPFNATGSRGTISANQLNGTTLASLGTGLMKNTTGTGIPSIAVSGMDYAPATSGSSILKGSSGGFAAATSADVVALFSGGAGCTGTNLLAANGTCQSGGTGSGGVYTAIVTAQTTLSVSASTHGQGITPEAACFDNSTPAVAVSCYYTRDVGGNVVFTWSPAFTGSIQIGTGGGGGGGGGGSGTVTTTGPFAINAIVVSASTGSTVIKTANSTATVDSSGNMLIPGTLGVTGHVTVEGVTSAGATGFGNLVFGTNPTLSGTLNGASATFSNTLAVTGHTTFEGVTSTGATGTGNLVYSASPTLTGTLTAATVAAGPLTATTGNFSSTLAVTGHTTFEGVTSSGATGTGSIVYSGTPTLVTPVLGVATATTINKVTLTAPATGSTLTIANGKTLTASNSLTLAGTDSTTMTFPSTSASISRIDATQTRTAGAKNIHVASATTAGLNVGSAALPSSPATGDIAIDSGASNALKWYDGTSWQSAAGGGGSGCIPGGSNGNLLADNGAGGCNSLTDFVFTTHTLVGGAASILDMSAASGTVGFKTPVAAGAIPTLDGALAMNSTNHSHVWGSNGTTMVGAVAATGTGTATTCTNQVVTAVSGVATPTCTTITSAYTSGVFSPDFHNLLSSVHSDTTASSPVRGGAIFAVGGSPTWQQVAHSSATGGSWKWNGTDVVASSVAVGGAGACATNQVVTSVNADAVPSCSPITPAFASGTTGSGNFVLATSPVLVTPTLGAASATSINGLGITTSTGTLSIANGKTFTSSNTLTMTGTDGSSAAFGGGGTVAYQSSPVTLTDGGTVTWAIGSTWEGNAALTFTTHGGSRTLNLTGMVAGGTYLARLTQDSTGGEGLVLGSGCVWKVANNGGGTVSLSTGANATDILGWYYDGSSCYANLQTAFN